MTSWKAARALVVTAGVAGLTWLVTGCSVAAEDPTATARDSHSYSLSGRTLNIEASEVTLKLKEGSGRRVTVDRLNSGAAVDAENTELRMEGDTLTLGVVCEGLVRSCDSVSTVSVPAGVTVHLKGSGTSVRADGLTGDLDLTVRNDGSIRVDRSRGSLKLFSGGGQITVSGARSSEVEARATADASIRLGFAAAPERVSARASGSVHLTVPAGPETYHIEGTGVRGNLTSDPGSHRTISLSANDGVARADRGA